MAEWPYSTSTWQRLRKFKLSTSPLCVECQRVGRIVPANHVDHVVSITSGGPPFPSLDGLASLCASCHSTKTNAEDRPDRRPGQGLYRGCGADGLPLDPAHPFLAEGDTPLQGRAAERSWTGPTPKKHLVRFGRR